MMLSFKNRQNIFRIGAWVIILGCLMLTAMVFVVIYNRERQKQRADFSIAAENRYAAVKRGIESDIEVLSSVSVFYRHAQVVTRSEFHNFTELLLRQHPGIQALVWTPRLPYAQREEYKKAAGRDGFKDFQITERSAQNKTTTAGKRSEYFPVYFVEPDKDEFILGYDLASSPVRKEALDRARDTGRMAATARITLAREKPSLSGFLVFAPIYQKDMPAVATPARKDNIRGFAVGIFRIRDFIEKSLTYLNPEGIDIYFYDISAPEKERFLYFHPSRTRKTADSLRNEGPVPDGGLKITRTIQVANREWQILFVATPDYIASGKTWQPWGVLLAGLLLTGLLAGFLIVVSRRAKELTNSNELFLQEIAGRKKTEEALRESEELFRSYLEYAPDGVYMSDMEGNFLYGNRKCEETIGYRREELLGKNFLELNILSEKSLNKAAQLLKANMEGKSTGPNEIELISKEGRLLPVEISTSAVQRMGQRIVLGFVRDITERKRAEEELRKSEERYRTILEDIDEGYYEIDLAGNFTFVNDAECRDLGYSREELIGMNNRQYSDEATAKNLYELYNNIYTTGKPVKRFLEQFISKDGTRHVNEVSASLIRDAKGKPIGFRGVSQDITARKRTEEELRLSEERFRRIFDEGPVGMVLVSPDYTIVTANKMFCGLLGYNEQEIIGQTFLDLTYEEDREKGRKFSGQLFAGSIPVFRLEKRYVRKDGGIVWAKITASAIHGNEGQVLYSLAIIEDLTDIKKAAEKIHLLHYYDSLTGLPNRTFHKELIKRSIEHAHRHKEIFALIYIGLDNFQRINDTLGHGIGDLLLKAVADRLTNSLRKSDYVARSDGSETVNVVSRVGGDEFIVLAHDLNHAQDAAIASGRLLREISAPYDLSGREVFMTTSIGIALYPDDGADVDDLLKNAEKAMRHTKSEGKNNYHFYSSSMHSSVLELLTLESDLHKALERNELVLYYQPKVDAATKMVKGMEALIRWKHPDRGLILPMQFIPLAETSGLILPIGEFVIRTVCGQVKTWQKAGYQQMNIALNISSRQFDQQSLIEIVKEALQNALIPPQCLELEITESIIMRNPEKAIRTLTELKAMGIRIAIDDFGTGYSSLSYLKRLPLDFLKIDQSFVQNLASDPNDQAIVRATIAMARSLNLKTIAEGVETEEQLSFLQEHGCDEIQGYLFSRPLPAEEIPGILAKGYL